MRKLIEVLVLTFVLASASAAQERTIINDRAAASLPGKHKLSLQWISWDYFGTVTVTNNAGVYSVSGSQKGRRNRDYLNIEGMIVSVDAKQFVFEGKVEIQVSHINGGKPCIRQGDLTFKITGKRKYWRMQEMDNPCDEATDYVDIYFK